MPQAIVKVTGVNRLVRKLSEAKNYERAEIRKELKTFAQVVVDAAIPEYQSMFVSGSRLDGTLEKSLRTSASVSKRGVSVSVKEGSAGYGPPKDGSAPYTGWIEFGGDLKPSGRRRGTIRRPFVKEGRVLFPTAKRMQGELVTAFEATMARIVRTFDDSGSD